MGRRTRPWTIWSLRGLASRLTSGQARPAYRGASDWRGGDGPLGVTKGTSDNPLYHAFLEAGASAGQGTTDDPNGYDPEGVSRGSTAPPGSGRRCSAARGPPAPVACRAANLSLITRATVERIAVSGNRACGVTFSHRGESRTVEARTGGDRVRRCAQLAPDPHAVGHRTGRSSARSRHRGPVRSSGGRPEPAGPRLGRDHAVALHPLVSGAHDSTARSTSAACGRRMVPDARRARRVQPLRGRRPRSRQPGRRLSQSCSTTSGRSATSTKGRNSG